MSCGILCITEKASSTHPSHTHKHTHVVSLLFQFTRRNHCWCHLVWSQTTTLEAVWSTSPLPELCFSHFSISLSPFTCVRSTLHTTEAVCVFVCVCHVCTKENKLRCQRSHCYPVFALLSSTLSIKTNPSCWKPLIDAMCSMTDIISWRITMWSYNTYLHWHACTHTHTHKQQ